MNTEPPVNAIEDKFDTYLHELIEISIDIGNRLQGVNLPDNTLPYAEVLGQKTLNHILSANFLFQGYTIKTSNGVEGSNIDFSSILVLTRAAMESYLTFNYVFIQPKTKEQKEFKFLCWDIAGYIERQEFEAFDKNQEDIKQQERIAISNLEKQLKANSVFQSLSHEYRNKILKGDWRPKKSWTNVACEAGFRMKFFKDQYKFLCAYS